MRASLVLPLYRAPGRLLIVTACGSYSPPIMPLMLLMMYFAPLLDYVNISHRYLKNISLYIIFYTTLSYIIGVPRTVILYGSKNSLVDFLFEIFDCRFFTFDIKSLKQSASKQGSQMFVGTYKGFRRWSTESVIRRI